ncbi:sodium- and chloride-dependent glycine transporter 1-like [Lineus longissimus]|uniref:sodium- and chloride-dependent glycine transporter 1-like n=1 Tax=Lineus longissimus TaxID=88925 RepID=UPI002B4EA19F
MVSEFKPRDLSFTAIKNFILRKKPTEVDETIEPKENGELKSVLAEQTEAEPERETWTGKLDFLLSCIGYAVGLGNVWRFPYLCYRNGGGAFLIPYVIMLAFAGLPLFFMELVLGQFASLGAITIWRISPIFKGLGYGMLVVTFLTCIYYNVIITYTIFYLFSSFAAEVPWASCDNTWNTELCYRSETIERDEKGDALNQTECVNSTSADGVTSFLNCTVLPAVNLTGRTSPSLEYWHRYVLEISDGIGEMGSVSWKLALCLLLAWIIVFACLCKGVKSSGKVVYFTATFPYVVLVILLIRGVTLPGSAEGVLFYVRPDFEKLKNAKVWGDAAVQIFYSLGPAWGGLITMASYNKFNNNCYRDAIIVAVCNCGTSVFAGFAIFSVIGFMAYSVQQPVATVADSGPGLAFVAYPEGISRMPVAPLWGILFFFMLITLGLDSQFTMMETIISAVVDEYPRQLRPIKTWITLGLCVLMFLLGLPLVTNAGIYYLTLIDWYAGGLSLMLIGLLETFVVSWIYGFPRFLEDIKMMIGFKPNYYWVACWTVLTPGLIVFIIIFSMSNYVPVNYADYKYPGWAEALGWLMSASSIICIPILMIVQFVKHVRTWENFKALFQLPLTGRTFWALAGPTSEWGPAGAEYRHKDAGTIAMEERIRRKESQAYENTCDLAYESNI